MKTTRDERPDWYLKVRFHYNDQPESVRIIRTRGETLSEVLDAVESFLRAAGFSLPMGGLSVRDDDEKEAG